MLIVNNQNNEQDLFEIRLVEWCESQVSNEKYGVFEVEEDVLLNMNENEVFILDLRKVCPSFSVKFYRNRMKDIPISMCSQCFKFFNTVIKNNIRKSTKTAS